MADRPEDLNKNEMASFIIDLLHRTFMHYALWFCEVEHQLGKTKALELMEEAWGKIYPIQIKRLSEIFGFALEDGVPAMLLSKNKDELTKVIQALGKNWLATDGIWFQTIESHYDIWEAKRCNDSCWVRFSSLEASSIKKFLQLPEQSGLAGLKKALSFRVYGGINKQTFINDTPDSIIFQMNECRVQMTRKRKNMEDYPCKSGGLVEYRNFAETIDSRLKMECIGCPPDRHPADWFCSWRFYLPR